MTGAYVWDGVRKAFHILIHDAFLLAVYSPPGRPLEKKGLGLVSVLPSVSVALVSTLATVSVHSVLKGFSHCPCGYTDGNTE